MFVVVLVFGTLVGVSVYSGMWSQLMTSAISCALWSSVTESGVCVHISDQE